jgi:hypothetical protein
MHPRPVPPGSGSGKEREPMRKILLTVAAGLGLVLGVAPASYAANADNPYGNVDHRNDAGNDTGDNRVDGLNNGQLNRNYQGPAELRAPAGQGARNAPLPPPAGVTTTVR